MSKIDEVRSAMVAAMKAKDKDTKETLSALLAALKNKAIDLILYMLQTHLQSVDVSMPTFLFFLHIR